MDKYIVTEYKYDNCTVRIHKPILTAEERRKREERVKEVLAEFGLERMRNQK